MYAAMSVLPEAIGPVWYFFALLSITLAGTIATSTLLYRIIELPFIQLGKSASLRPATAP
jgi:peptidoglycan/LPS O-acetylase OafA/YrhL